MAKRKKREQAEVTGSTPLEMSEDSASISQPRSTVGEPPAGTPPAKTGEPSRSRIVDTPAREPLSGEPAEAAPDRRGVARRAYELYVERGRTDGADVDDWLRAERELARSGTHPRKS